MGFLNSATNTLQCYRRQGESVSVSGRNFKEDILIKPGWLVSR
jgi:vacuolar protein sorting-associated protein 3